MTDLTAEKLSKYAAWLLETANDCIADHLEDCAREPDERHDLNDPECEVNAVMLRDYVNATLPAKPSTAVPVAWRWRFKSPMIKSWSFGETNPFAPEVVNYEIEPLYASRPDPSPVGEVTPRLGAATRDQLWETGILQHRRLKALQKAMREAIDLLAERTQGSPARSPSHNARLVLEDALTKGVGRDLGLDVTSNETSAVSQSSSNGEVHAIGWLTDNNYEPTEAMMQAGLEFNHRHNSPDNLRRSFREMMLQAELDGLVRMYFQPLPAQSRQEGWQPIASAPKDGTHLWMYWPSAHPDDQQSVGWWHEDIRGAWWMDHADTEREGPTHWMPLPASPAEVNQ